MTTRKIIIIYLASVAVLASAIAVCRLYGVESDPWAACAVDAPMEQAHCRALEVTP